MVKWSHVGLSGRLGDEGMTFWFEVGEVVKGGKVKGKFR